MNGKDENDTPIERRKKVNVEDKKVEIGVNLQVILTSLILGVMTWVGVNINKVKDDMASIKEFSALTAQKVSFLEKQLTDHMQNEHMHWHGPYIGDKKK